MDARFIGDWISLSGIIFCYPTDEYLEDDISMLIVSYPTGDLDYALES